MSEITQIFDMSIEFFPEKEMGEQVWDGEIDFQFEHFHFEILVKVIWSSPPHFEKNGIMHFCH